MDIAWTFHPRNGHFKKIPTCRNRSEMSTRPLQSAASRCRNVHAQLQGDWTKMSISDSRRRERTLCQLSRTPPGARVSRCQPSIASSRVPYRPSRRRPSRGHPLRDGRRLNFPQSRQVPASCRMPIPIWDAVLRLRLVSDVHTQHHGRTCEAQFRDSLAMPAAAPDGADRCRLRRLERQGLRDRRDARALGCFHSR